MKKTVYTLNINNFCPEITVLTYPLLERYAEKIGADFQVITERKFPDWPAVAEKFQVYELGKDNDWSMLIDSDALVHPDTFDPTEHISKDTVMHNGADMATNRWKYDRFFRRDGRHIGSCTWFCVASDWCRELWKPPEDQTLEEIVKNIYPLINELKTVKTPASLIDDYTFSRNIAKYGLKFKTFYQILDKLQDRGDYLWHLYTIVKPEKVRQMKEVLRNWHLMEPPNISTGHAYSVGGWMMLEELRWLAIQALEHKSIVEIGSFIGRSTLALADNTLGKVYAIDDWKGPRDVPIEQDRTNLYQHFLDNIQGRNNIFPIKMDCADLHTLQFDSPPDMIFIDGDHSYPSVKRDVAWALSVSTPTTLICGHDYERPEVRRAIREVLEPAYQILSGVGLLWWAYRK